MIILSDLNSETERQIKDDIKTPFVENIVNKNGKRIIHFQTGTKNR